MLGPLPQLPGATAEEGCVHHMLRLQRRICRPVSPNEMAGYVPCQGMHDDSQQRSLASFPGDALVTLSAPARSFSTLFSAEYYGCLMHGCCLRSRMNCGLTNKEWRDQACEEQ